MRFRQLCLICAFAMYVNPTSADPFEDQTSTERIATEILRSGIWGQDVGAWHTKTQLYVDPQSRSLTRRTITVWDPWPSRKYDFIWRPIESTAPNELADGPGQLIWLSRDIPNYDQRAVIGVYRGEMKRGRPEGHGQYTQQDGLTYEGEWVDGQIQGYGRLVLANGDELTGTFVDGKANGIGKYIDATGEMFQGTFVNGQRDGRATTRLANGAVYESVWHNNEETAQSRTIRVAQTTPAAPADNNVQIRVKVDRIADLAFAGADPGDVPTTILGYESSNNDNIMQIRPSSARMLKAWKGNANIQLTPNEEVADFRLLPEISYGLFSYARSVAFPLRLTIEVENKRSRAIRVESSYIDVSRSTADNQPAIQASVGYYDLCSGADFHSTPPFSSRITFENFGWAAAENATIQYKFVNPNTADVENNYDHSRSIGNIERSVEVNLEHDLNALGVNTSYFARESKKKPEKRTLKCEFKAGKLDLNSCLTTLGGAKTFGSLVDKVAFPKNSSDSDAQADLALQLQLTTDVTGILEYNWTDQAGSSHHRVSPFRSHIRLGVVNEAVECGEGAGAETQRQEAIQLKLNQLDYRVPLAFKDVIRSGKRVRYSFGLNARQSSEHDFAIVLVLDDGEIIRSRPMNFLFYAPSWYPSSARQ